MTKLELTQQLSRRFPNIPESSMADIVEHIFKEITKTLIQQKHAKFRRFGAFSIRYRNDRIGRNPKTGEKIQIKRKGVPVFKCGCSLLVLLNS